MAPAGSMAAALVAGDDEAVMRLGAGLIRLRNSNFVERPWGGVRVREYKGLHPLPDQVAESGQGLGEAFEIAACEADAEARAHPSTVVLDDGSTLPLPRLLEQHAARLFGERFVARYGTNFPLLPKTLDVRELLSVQGHPAGGVEVYVIVAAEPGATIRVGFKRDIDAVEWSRKLAAGRAGQMRLLALVEECVEPQALQDLLQPWFAERDSAPDVVIDALVAACPHVAAATLRSLLAQLKSLYWEVLDAMNAIPVAAGDVIYNANPARIVAQTGAAASAEVHALGNPECREVLALEIRFPGLTFRAWDNVRFPVREVDVDGALGVLNLTRTEADEFRAPRVAVRAGVFRSVSAPQFEIEHLCPRVGQQVEVPEEPTHSLHVIAGGVRVSTAAGVDFGELWCGESAIVPSGVGAYVVEALAEEAEVIKAGLPELRAGEALDGKRTQP